MFFKKKEPVITFVPFLSFHLSSQPVLASQVVPEWYKKTASYIPEEKKLTSERTIKRCMPVFDAMSAGYIISTPCDISVTQIDGEPQYEPSMRDTIQYHPQKQATFHPKAHPFQFPKFINAWGIKTPKGYSCLFIAPMHNENPWFECLAGLVDTDRYDAPVNFPFVLKDPKFEGIIPAGTPMIQVIPFKREDWGYGIGNDKDVLNAQETDKELSIVFFDRYKRLFRDKKIWNRKL